MDFEALKNTLMTRTAEGGLSALLSVLIRLMLALAIFLIGKRLIHILKNAFNRSFEKVDMEISVRKFLIALIQALAYVVMILIIAEMLGIPSSTVIAVLGSAGLALSLSLQGTLSNFAGGVLILVMKPFKVGDYIVTSTGQEGKVAVIGLVYTTLLTPDNKQVVIPNATISSAPLTNVTGQDKRRVDLTVGISYDADLKLAKELMRQLLEGHPMHLQQEPVQVFVDQLADSCVVIGGRCWTSTDDYWTAKWDLQEQVKLAYDEAGIEIPYPQMDVHMK